MIEEEEVSFPHPLAMFLVAVVSACVVAFCIWVTNFYIKKTRGYDFTWNLIAPESCELKLGHKGYYRLSTNSDSTLWAIRYGGEKVIIIVDCLAQWIGGIFQIDIQIGKQ